MKHILGISIIILSLAALGVVWDSANRYIDLKKTEQKQTAISDCMNVSSYTHTDPKTGVTTVEPMKDHYEFCKKEKGY